MTELTVFGCSRYGSYLFMIQLKNRDLEMTIILMTSHYHYLCNQAIRAFWRYRFNSTYRNLNIKILGKG